MNLNRAACIGYEPDWWFATEYRSAELATALLICNGDERNPVCPIRQACLEAAMVEEAGSGNFTRAGVRGGLTALQRTRLAKGLNVGGLQPCGTRAAYRRHLNAGETCPICRPRVNRKRRAA